MVYLVQQQPKVDQHTAIPAVQTITSVQESTIISNTSNATSTITSPVGHSTQQPQQQQHPHQQQQQQQQQMHQQHQQNQVQLHQSLQQHHQQLQHKHDEQLYKQEPTNLPMTILHTSNAVNTTIQLHHLTAPNDPPQSVVY